MHLNVKKFALCLKELGITDLGFSTRKKLKNLAYLLTVFGVDLELSLADWKWYLHGIYNPEFTKVLFGIEKEPLDK